MITPAAIARRLRRERAPIRFLASRALWRSGLSRLLTFRAHGVRLRFFPSALSASLWLNPRDREDDVALVRSLLRPGDLMVDVGANVGLLALVGARAVGAGGRVIAIEPHPRVFGYLLANLTLNDATQAHALNRAVGAVEGELLFSDRRTDDQNGVVAEGGLKVAVSRLDDLLAAVTGPIRLLKVDVEGFERAVFQGAAATLARTEAVFFESCDAHFARFGHTSREVIALLEEAGFVVHRDTGGSWAPIAPDYTSATRENLLALRDASTTSITRS